MVPRVRERMDSREFILERKVLKRPEREKVWFGQECSSINSIDKHTHFRVHINYFYSELPVSYFEYVSNLKYIELEQTLA